MFKNYSGFTRVLFIVGDPIAQVKSPAAMTQALRELGRDVIVVPIHVSPADLGHFVESAKRLPNVDGIIVTVPHKFAAVEHATALTSRAHSIGSINMIRRGAEGLWLGDMCDGEAYVAGLRKARCEPHGRHVLLVGAGGAGAAISHALVDTHVASLTIHDSDADRRDALLQRLKRYTNVPVVAGSRSPNGADLVINATPLGMHPEDPMPLDVAALPSSTFVGDVVTQPAETPLLVAARARGCQTMNGLCMYEGVLERMVSFFAAER